MMDTQLQPVQQQQHEEEEENGTTQQQALIVDSLPVSFVERAKFFVGAGLPITGGLLLLGTGGFAPVIGGIVAGVIATFAGELKEMGSSVMYLGKSGIHALPTLPAAPARSRQQYAFPCDEENTKPEEEDDERPDRVLVPEPIYIPTVPSPSSSSSSTSLMRLAANFLPDVDEIIGEGIIVFGSKGSGKTNVGALLAEQFSRFLVPIVIFDIEGDYASVVNEFPNGYHIGAASMNVEQAFQAGHDILEHGYQVVFDLSSYESDEVAAQVMIQVIKGLTDWANRQPPRDRVPCLVFLDEAAYWLPQQKVSYLSADTQKALLDTFHVLATKGRKRGLTPILLTQRISEIKKEVMAQANIYFLGKQSLDNDLDRYTEYVRRDVATREQIAAFGKGQFIVKLADGTQFITQFYERHSKHSSHTPKASAAMARYAQTRKRPTLHTTTVTRRAPLPTLPPMEPMPMRNIPLVEVSQKQTDLEQAITAWNAGHTSVTKLENALHVTHHRAYQLYQNMKERRLV